MTNALVTRADADDLAALVHHVSAGKAREQHDAGFFTEPGHPADELGQATDVEAVIDERRQHDRHRRGDRLREEKMHALFFDLRVERKALRLGGRG